MWKQVSGQGPLVSFIIASYNYEQYLETAVRSILKQTVHDFEIVVVDDASSDGSREVVQGFVDPRIRLHVNDKNMGPAPTYNRGAMLARGEYISYLDADDWIDSRKTEAQLDHFRHNPDVDILGTYVNFHDANGDRHPLAPALETHLNRPHDLNRMETWVVQNNLSAPSVMLPRSLHDRIGLRDPNMTMSDFELWLRACGGGCRFDVVPLPLLSYRLHGDSASQRYPPRETFLEVSYALQKNVMPFAKAAADRSLAAKAVAWVVSHEEFAGLDRVERLRLLAFLMSSPQRSGFAAYRRALGDNDLDPVLLPEGEYWRAALDLEPSGKGGQRSDQEVARCLEARAWHDRSRAARLWKASENEREPDASLNDAEVLRSSHHGRLRAALSWLARSLSGKE